MDQAGLPKGYEDRVPQVKMVEDENKWVFDDIVSGGVGSASVIDHELEGQLVVAYLCSTPVHEIAQAASQ